MKQGTNKTKFNFLLRFTVNFEMGVQKVVAVELLRPQAHRHRQLIRRPRQQQLPRLRPIRLRAIQEAIPVPIHRRRHRLRFFHHDQKSENQKMRVLHQ